MKIEFKDVWYDVGDNHILQGVNFMVPHQGNRVILGSSGSGKTTILRLLLRLIKPSRGAIFADEVDLSSMDEKTLSLFRKRIAIVFQHGALFDSLSVGENVGYRLMEEKILKRREVRQIVEQALEFVGLSGEENKMPSELSGGMKKRVAIARALASGADTILFDEPTAGLDPVNAANITQFITQLRDHHSVTTVVVSHDLHHAFEVASQILILDAGEIIFEGSVDELRRAKDRRVTSFIAPSAKLLVSSDMEAFMKLSRKRLEQLS